MLTSHFIYDKALPVNNTPTTTTAPPSTPQQPMWVERDLIVIYVMLNLQKRVALCSNNCNNQRKRDQRHARYDHYLHNHWTLFCLCYDSNHAKNGSDQVPINAQLLHDVRVAITDSSWCCRVMKVLRSSEAQYWGCLFLQTLYARHLNLFYDTKFVPHTLAVGVISWQPTIVCTSSFSTKPLLKCSKQHWEATKA